MTPKPPGSVRIIAGRWRNSRLDVADAAGLRPTSERVRETVFNWLQPRLPGARCLDLFAGSGALGLEAASRGAAQVLLIERDPRLVQRLRASVERLNATQVRVLGADANAWLASASASEPFDIVFVDPPFALDLWNRTLASLAPVLASDARVYVEASPDAAIAVPVGWSLLREGRTREVRYALYAVGAQAPATLTTGQGNQRDIP
ncbi:MAG: 16S rRNA (guanine(966)-N(2))-methyltransferase RsmD [Xanthomonadaceae bacterium]|nr:16S rRNA (guanine(966)-N(2))-methyltransferase RsmD [Xanthomonadaceae bacterium]